MAIPLDIDDSMTLGYLHHKKIEMSSTAARYLELLKEHIRNYGFKIF